MAVKLTGSGLKSRRAGEADGIVLLYAISDKRVEIPALGKDCRSS